MSAGRVAAAHQYESCAWLRGCGGCQRPLCAARLWPPGSAGVLKVGHKLLAERVGVAGPQVDLIVSAVDGVPDGLIGRAAVEVVFEGDGYFLGHPGLPCCDSACTVLRPVFATQPQ